MVGSPGSGKTMPFQQDWIPNSFAEPDGYKIDLAVTDLYYYFS